MSQIDQAFIRAYKPEEEYRAQPVSATPTSVAQFSAAPSSVAPSMAAEPIPAPHFRGSENSDAYVDTATMQQGLLTSGSGVATIEPLSQRRPLSTYAAPEQPVEKSFQPAFEIDAFRWPEIVSKLLGSHRALLDSVVEQLLKASEEGRSMVGIAGLRPRVGCSTVLMCLARLMAEAGKSVAMVDGNFASNTLAKNLGLEFDIGWEDVLSGRVPLAESFVHSLDDRIALLPLSGGSDSPVELLAGIQTSVTAGVLRYHYDLVLFDLGSPERDLQLGAVREIITHCRIDASILVADTSDTDDESNQQADHLMSLFGPTCLGLIGNSN